jgi:hypothetical protein
MQSINFLVIFLVSFIPLVIGFVWYNPKVFGTIWMHETGMTEEKAKEANLFMIFGITFFMSFLFAFALQFSVVHQFHIFSVLQNEVGFAEKTGDAYADLTYFMTKYGHNFISFKHGAIHGFIGSVFTYLPIITINSLFEKKSIKYVLITFGYWTLSAILMGGFICQFTKF